MKTLSILLIFVLIVANIHFKDAVSLRDERKQHKGIALTDKQIMKISNMTDMRQFESVLDRILIPRVVGTPTHQLVKEFLIQSMINLGWHVETDRFKAKTPIFGTLEFENVIAKLNPNARRYLVLACHYDSKYYREGGFLGATDSAVPCAMMINLAHTLRQQLDNVKNENTLSLKLVFFDGEEAFKHWSHTDSIYGAKHLAQKWEKLSFPKNNRDGTNYLHSLDVLVLLDLLGAPDPQIYNYFSNTERWYRVLVNMESKLSNLNQLVRYSSGKPEQRYFQSMSSPGGIEDDHIPFLNRGVPILHLIPYPFPSVWHTDDDNRNAVDMATVENLNKILRGFVSAYLKLSLSNNGEHAGYSSSSSCYVFCNISCVVVTTAVLHIYWLSQDQLNN